MLIARTTVTRRDDAERLASEAVARGLSICVQIEAPVVSHYRWQGQQERSEEIRLCFKLMPNQRPALEAWLFANHPYETPEWVAIHAAHVGEKYLSWAVANSTSQPF